MENEYLQKLTGIASAFNADRGDIFFGNEIIFRKKQQQNPEQLANKFAGFIYSNCYCRDGSNTIIQSEAKISAVADDGFISRLRAANMSSGNASEKWKVTMQMPNGDPVTAKGTNAFSISKNDIVANALPSINASESYVTIRNPKELLSNDNSFYFAFSDNAEGKKTGALLRFYWNIDADGAPLLINKLTGGLNRHYVPFQFKCLKHPALYSRHDACVLYIFPQHLHIVNIIIRQLAVGLKPYLKEGVPMFTLKLCDGLSFAESPAGGQSFGMQHARIISKALLGAFEQQLPGQDKLAHITGAYRLLGYDLSCPYKNPGSAINYSFLKHHIN